VPAQQADGPRRRCLEPLRLCEHVDLDDPAVTNGEARDREDMPCRATTTRAAGIAIQTDGSAGDGRLRRRDPANGVNRLELAMREGCRPKPSNDAWR